MLVFSLPEFYAELEQLQSRGDLSATEEYLRKTLAYVDNYMTTAACATCGNDPAQENSENRREELEWVITRAKGIIAVISELGSLCRDTGRLEEALGCFERARAELEEAGLSGEASHAMALLNLGVVQRMLGQPERALENLAAAQAILTLAGDDDTLANVCNNIGLTQRLLKQPAEAAASFEEALAYAEKAENREAVPAILDNLATTLQALGDGAGAKTAIDRAIALLNGAPTPQLAACLNTRAVLAYYAGDYAASVQSFEQAAELTKQLFGAGPRYAAICRNCSAAASKAGDGETAAKYAALGKA